jgi:hypothetical protein
MNAARTYTKAHRSILIKAEPERLENLCTQRGKFLNNEWKGNEGGDRFFTYSSKTSSFHQVKRPNLWAGRRYSSMYEHRTEPWWRSRRELGWRRPKAGGVGRVFQGTEVGLKTMECAEDKEREVTLSSIFSILTFLIIILEMNRRNIF